MSLRLRIVLIFAVFAIFLLGYIFVYFTPSIERNTRHNLLEATKSHLSTIGESLTPFILQNQFGAIHNNLDALLDQNPAWIFMGLDKEKGNRIYPLKTVEKKDGPFTETLKHTIKFRGKDIARLTLTVNYEEKIKNLHSSHIHLVELLAVGFILILFFIAVFLDTLISKPTKGLVSAANLLAGGNFEASLPKPRNDEIGSLIRSFSTMRDSVLQNKKGLEKEIEERKKAEEGLIKSKDYLEKLNNSLGEAIFTVKMPERKIEYVNRSLETVFGYRADECVGKNTEMFYPTLEDFLDFGRKLKNFIGKEEEVLRTEQLLKRKNGETFMSEVTITFLKENDDITHVISTVRDISVQKQAEKELSRKNIFMQLLREVAITANESSSIEEALQLSIDRVCQYLSWPVGHVYMLSEDSRDKLVPTSIWSMVDQERFKVWHDKTMKIIFDRGVGLIGRVLASRKPTWIIDVRNDPTFLRQHIAQDIGVKTGFAFPVMVGEKVEAVLEFFTSEIVEPHSDLLEVMANIGAQLGRVIERKQAGEALKESHDKLEQRVSERTAELTLENEKMSNALYRAEDVLNIISKPPSLVPFFVTSPVYRLVRSIGGGDTIRWLNFKSEYAGIYLHDVSGHDIQEILLNILATSIVDDHKANPRIKSISMPSLFLADMNERLLKFCDGTPQYITALYLLLNFNMREIHLSLAGHPKPWLINSDGTAEQIGKHGFILGQFEIDPENGDAYEDITVRLKNGQMLFLYSDGLMEQTNGQGLPFEKKFREKIVPRLNNVEPESAYEILKAEFEAHLDGNQPDDDVSFIFLGTRPAGMYESFEFVPDQQLIKILEDRRSRFGKLQNQVALNTNIKSNDRAKKRGVRTINDISESYEAITTKLLENGWSQEKTGHVKIALDEVVVNAIMHGNLCSDRYIVKVSHILHRDILEVYVADEGEGFGSFNITQRVTEEDLLKESGRGLFITSKYATKMYFNETGNKCWTIFTKS